MTATDHEALFLRPAEAAKLAGLAKRTIQRGELRATRLCSRLRIPRVVAGGAMRVERPIVESEPLQWRTGASAGLVGG